MTENIRVEWINYLSRFNWNLHFVINFSSSISLQTCKKRVELFLKELTRQRNNKITVLHNQWFCFFFLVKGHNDLNHCHVVCAIQYHKIKSMNIDKFCENTKELCNDRKSKYKFIIPYIRQIVSLDESRIISKYFLKESNSNLYNSIRNEFGSSGNSEKLLFEGELLRVAKIFDPEIHYEWFMKNEERIVNKFSTIYKDFFRDKIFNSKSLYKYLNKQSIIQDNEIIELIDTTIQDNEMDIEFDEKEFMTNRKI